MHVLTPLESLCTVEESAVRDKATLGIKRIFSVIKVKELEGEVIGMIRRLMNGDWFTSKLSAATLIPSVFLHVSSANQQELMNMFQKVSVDEIP